MSVGERVARVETEILQISKQCTEHLKDLREVRDKDLREVRDKLVVYHEETVNLLHHCQTALEGTNRKLDEHVKHTLSGRDKAVIVGAIIEGLIALALAVVGVFT